MELQVSLVPQINPIFSKMALVSSNPYIFASLVGTLQKTFMADCKMFWFPIFVNANFLFFNKSAVAFSQLFCNLHNKTKRNRNSNLFNSFASLPLFSRMRRRWSMKVRPNEVMREQGGSGSEQEWTKSSRILKKYLINQIDLD